MSESAKNSSSGKWIIALILLTAFAMGGSLYFTFSHSKQLRDEVANQLQVEFEKYLITLGKTEKVPFRLEVRQEDLALVLGKTSPYSLEVLQPLFSSWYQERFGDSKKGKPLAELEP
ncbi:MAG: hypothetical protein LW875_08815 [Proteobacteria bacterium]|jgi:hypothetical protein|nr:hypothetical protein [Pseudomonadota bacterium]